MKEKRVDIYLTEAGICHVVLVGAGGTSFNEIIKDTPQWSVIIFSGTLSIIVALLMRRQILKARALTRKSKKNNYD